MRARALFAIAFGLGVGAVAVGTTVSRLVVGPASRHDADSPPAAAAVAPSPPSSSIAAPPVTSSVPAPRAVAVEVEPRAEVVPQRRRGITRRHLRAPADEAPVASVPVPEQAKPRLLEPATAVEAGPVAIVRGGTAPLGARESGPRIIRIDPENAGR